jgi:phosphoglycolate phosphatase-like HAD superfamily hydrolase
VSGRWVALDLDGTLVDCRARQVALAAALVPALEQKRFWAAKRSGASTFAALVACDVTSDEAETAARRWAERIEDDGWLVLDRPLAGAADALARLRRSGLRLLVLTARRRVVAVRAQLASLGFAAQVDATEIVDPADASAYKAVVLRRYDAVALIGDTESDARAAGAAGVRFLGVASGQRSRDFLAAHGVEPVYEGVLDAVAAL